MQVLYGGVSIIKKKIVDPEEALIHIQLFN
jgi:hypothetical protein